MNITEEVRLKKMELLAKKIENATNDYLRLGGCTDIPCSKCPLFKNEICLISKNISRLADYKREGRF